MQRTAKPEQPTKPPAVPAPKPPPNPMGADQVAAALVAMANAIKGLTEAQTVLNQHVSGIRDELAQNAAAVRRGVQMQKEREQRIRDLAHQVKGEK